MLDLKKISAREMDAAELTEAVPNRTSGVDLDGAIVRLRAYDVRRGVASGMDRELLRDLQRRCLNFSLEIHAEETARGPGEERLPDRRLRTTGRGVRGVRRRAQGARRAGGEVRGRVPGEGARVPDAGGERGAGERRVILERLFIENYKQLREPVELYPPEGAIGIVGANGAGKSTLFESILWAFFGSRGGGPRFANESIPWSGGSTKDPTTVEVTLATDGGSFTVRRRLKSGSTSAEALDAQDRTVVSGTADVTRWVEENLLGMDRTAFEATFYARQKELRFFAHDEGISRVRKISRLLGISSVETAQSFLREDRNTLRSEARLLEGRLAEADLDSLQTELENASKECERLETELEKVSEEHDAAEEDLEVCPRGSRRPGGHIPRALAPHVRPARGRGRQASRRRPPHRGRERPRRPRRSTRRSWVA